ncbi:MAG: zinc-binding dehydrogenase [Clostridia bacterium]|nr:zinc-binding dehydrogenase [Clostridia bacterium]
MINEIIKLTSPKNLEIFFEDEKCQEDAVIVRPTYLSICAADQRYYQGKRKKEILDKKLPLALIHEGVGQVVYDRKNEFKKGEKVVLIPNTPVEKDDIIKENYLRSSKFRSSSADGFMQNVVSMERDRIIPIRDIREDVSSLLELCSVSINAIENFLKKSHQRKDVLGVWGCGSVGYITALLLRSYFPDSKIVVMGTRTTKLNYFSFVDETKMVTELEDGFKVDHAFECVGGTKAEEAIEQIIDHINPEGCISLLGVSEEPVDINTRMVLEKGLTLLGNSRSSYEDFEKSVELLQDKQTQDYLSNIISQEITINQINDINEAFDADLNNDFKTVMKWNL